jgi:hypothetical protein
MSEFDKLGHALTAESFQQIQPVDLQLFRKHLEIVALGKVTSRSIAAEKI